MGKIEAFMASMEKIVAFMVSLEKQKAFMVSRFLKNYITRQINMQNIYVTSKSNAAHTLRTARNTIYYCPCIRPLALIKITFYQPSPPYVCMYHIQATKAKTKYLQYRAFTLRLEHSVNLETCLYRCIMAKHKPQKLKPT